MHEAGLADDTFVAAAPDQVAGMVADPGRWATWWPDLTMQVSRDRGREGVQWVVSGALRGSAELWLEAVGDGTVVHFYLRAPMTGRDRRRRALAWKRHVHALKDALEGPRAPGTPVRPSAGRSR